jgi:hypothetical protein
VSRRRELAEAAIGVAVLACIFLAVRLFVASFIIRGFFAAPTAAAPAGGAVWSNLVASVICVLVAWWRIRTRMIAHHATALAQARLHHQERMDQAEEHHQAAIALAQDHHAELVKQQAGNHAALVEHVTETAKRPVRRTGKVSP